MQKVAITMDLEFLDKDESTSRNKGSIKKEKEAVENLLDLLKRRDQKMTFFVVSNLCEDHADLLHRIKNEGHEIASHSASHRYLTQISESEMKKEITESKKQIENELGIEVKGFRAPALKKPSKFNKFLSQAGYEYDSSKIPSLTIPGWFGGDDVGLKPFQNGEIKEVPISINPVFRTPISAFFLRTSGKKYVKWSIQMLRKRGIIPVLYVHPYDLAYFSKQGSKWRHRFRSGDYTINAIKEILSESENTTISEMIR